MWIDLVLLGAFSIWAGGVLWGCEWLWGSAVGGYLLLCCSRTFAFPYWRSHGPCWPRSGWSWVDLAIYRFPCGSVLHFISGLKTPTLKIYLPLEPYCVNFIACSKVVTVTAKSLGSSVYYIICVFVFFINEPENDFFINQDR